MPLSREKNDEWTFQVKGRLEFVNDLRAKDALYHGLCDVRFRNGREKQFSSEQTPDASRKRGRKLDEEREEVLIDIIEYFKADKVERSEEEEKYHIVRTAAKITKSDIKLLESKLENYSTSFEMESAENNLSYLPISLQILLENLFVGKDNPVTIPSIGQAIIQQVKPRALIAPLGPAVQMHRHFGSRFLLNSLNKHGYCASYNEVLNYERCAAVSQGTKIPGLNRLSLETKHFSST